MKFSIRDLFLVTVIAALVLGWGLDRSRLAADRDDWKFRTETLAEWLTGLGYKAHWNKESVEMESLHNSQAPAPISPKNQSATNPDP